METWKISIAESEIIYNIIKEKNYNFSYDILTGIFADENNNTYDLEYVFLTIDDPEKLTLIGLVGIVKDYFNSLENCKNCDNCIDCKNCLNCQKCIECTNCIDCYNCCQIHNKNGSEDEGI